MADSGENSALFPIFILSIIALPLVPYTILKLLRAASKEEKSIHCACSVCSRSGKYRKSIFRRVSFQPSICIQFYVGCMHGAMLLVLRPNILYSNL